MPSSGKSSCFLPSSDTSLMNRGFDNKCVLFEIWKFHHYNFFWYFWVLIRMKEGQKLQHVPFYITAAISRTPCTSGSSVRRGRANRQTRLEPGVWLTARKGNRSLKRGRFPSVSRDKELWRKKQQQDNQSVQEHRERRTHQNKVPRSTEGLEVHWEQKRPSGAAANPSGKGYVQKWFVFAYCHSNCL